MNRRAGGLTILVMMTVALLVTFGCGSSAENPAGTFEGQPALATQEPDTREVADMPGVNKGVLVINVDLTDHGFVPANYHIPKGKRVTLVVRNRGMTEHHYHIIGLIPQDMMWLAKGDAADASDPQEGSLAGAADHDHDHGLGSGMVPFHICTSSRICPTGESVHAHAEVRGVDKIEFTAANRGVFQIEDPLNPAFSGTVTVY